MSYSDGLSLRANLMDGRPTHMKYVTNYTGYSVPVCGDYKTLSGYSETVPWPVGQTDSLHEEIRSFYYFMKSTNSEKRARHQSLLRLNKAIGDGVELRPVGSYVTGLSLPTSDIDVVLTSRTASAYDLRSLSYRLYANYRVNDVLRAKVPLIRVTEIATGQVFDITANKDHSEAATRIVQVWEKQLDAEFGRRVFRRLMFVLKQFLSMRKLGTTYTGGVNSYVLVWMVVAWMKLAYKKSTSDVLAGFERLSLGGASATSTRKHDLGDMLIGFFRFYGVEFDYANTKIVIDSHPAFVRKPTYAHYNQMHWLQIYDPVAGTDMGLKIYAMGHVRATFREAYNSLASAKQKRLALIMKGNYAAFKAEREQKFKALSFSSSPCAPR